MKKILFLFATFAILLFASSAFNEERFGLSTGNMVAPLQLENATGRLSLDQMQGQYLLLSFWRSDDAASRLECNKAEALANEWYGSRTPVKHIGINMDTDTDLFEALVAADGLDASAQYNISAEQIKELTTKYKLDGNLGTLLVGKDGRVLAVNADQKTFAALTR